MMDAAAAAVTGLPGLFALAQRKSARLAQHVHPDWVSAALPGHAAWALQEQCGPALARVSLLLGRLYGVRWPGLVSLRDRAHRVAVLTRPLALRVLATAALYVQRAAVRRCVGRDARQALVDLVGEPAYAALLAAPDAGGPRAEVDLRQHDLDFWAAEGYRALHVAGAWRCKDASVIARLLLAPGAFDGAAPADAAPADDMAAFVHQLDSFFPEQSWLFGSDMDRVLWASPTASCAEPTSPS
jgi:Bacterial type III secretion protein (HrpB4)